MTVGELLARTDAYELSEWKAYEQECGPLGPERGDWQAANVAYTFAMLMGGKRSRRLKLTDFLLKWSGRRHQTPEEQLRIFRALAAKHAAVEAAKSE